MEIMINYRQELLKKNKQKFFNSCILIKVRLIVIDKLCFPVSKLFFKTILNLFFPVKDQYSTSKKIVFIAFCVCLITSSFAQNLHETISFTNFQQIHNLVEQCFDNIFGINFGDLI
eukprot:TRINITY_DN10673_c0_g2_i1.p4 TRINITY_DN10673_c0_g2~~TRINITY_DN10673_c0_g2_i1.p4  ORF type:complete len:116 (-),score=2.56 TRINITY_DN10673_c0_g2_i1:336-683(-)